MTQLRLALCCLGLAAGLAVAADEPRERTIPYEKLYAPLAAVRQADPDGVVTATLRAEAVQPGQALPADLKIALRHGGAEQPIQPQPDGLFALPEHPEWGDGTAQLWINQPHSEVKIVETFMMRTPKSTKLRYGQLMESVAVLERIQSRHVEIGGMLSTPPAGVELAFAPGAAQTVSVGNGTKARIWTSDAQGLLKIPFDAAMPADTPVELSALPIALQPYGP